MLPERNINFLIKNRIIYRREPIKDVPSEIFEWGYYYDQGTYEYYSLFNSKARIKTIKALVWHLSVIWYLNPQLDQEQFNMVARFISDKKNGFVTFSISEYMFTNILYDVSIIDLERPPTNKIRKIIFKDNSGLSLNEKLSIVGQIIGKSKKISESDIYEAMLYMHDLNEKITIKKLAERFECTTRTIHRNMGNELKKEKELLNKNL